MSYAKTILPVLPHLFQRTRLFDLLDQYRDRQVIWVHGQAGAGKTSLVAGYVSHCGVKPLWYRMDAGDDDPATFFHYFGHAAEALLSAEHRPLPRLTPESLYHLEPFTRRFFRELFAGLQKPIVLVFDNVQELAPNSPLNEIIAMALSEIPRQMNAILISRCPPPASLSRMQFNRTLATLDQSDLRLTDEEALGLSRLWLPGEIRDETIQRMNELVDGWIAGLVLLLERGGYEDSPKGIDRDYFFNYFTSEIFDRLDADTQRFLLHTACLDGITAAVARELTGIPQAQEILEDLYQRHYFTSRSDQDDPIYQYHPLFRDFLLIRGKNEIGSEDLSRITGRAAHILSCAGQTEEAIELATTATDWPLLCDLLNRHAPVMLGQHRFKSLEKWLEQLPSDVLNTSPWLLYWFGSCRLPFDQRNSADYFKWAYEGFKAQETLDGMLLSASGAILAIMTEWDDFRSLDPWIAVLDERVGRTTVYPSVNIEARVVLAMIGALLFRRPQHPAMAYWESRATVLLQENGIDISVRLDIGNILVHWQYWKGDLASASHTIDILDQLADPGGSATLPRLSSVMNHAIHDWHTANVKQCLACIDDGLALAAEMDIHIMDDRLMAQSVYASLSQNDLSTAGHFLDRMKQALQHARRLAMSQHHYLSSQYHLIAGNLELARQHGQRALELNREVGTPYPEALTCIALAQVQFEMGERESAADLLTDGHTLACDIQSRTLELLYELTAAWFHLQQRQTEAMLTHLHRGLMLQRKMGFLCFPGWRSSQMKPLLLAALENNIEPEFVQRLIHKHNLRPDVPPPASEKWPWPVKITTLGHFSLLVDGQPLQFSGKTQQKPLELLKVLIASGGLGVGKDRLIDMLWPETDGDKAHRALDTTLHRLRKLVGYDQVIQVQDRKLSLNAQLCWIDIWALEHLLGMTEELPGQPSPNHEQAILLKQQLTSLYRGGFLNHDDEPICIPVYRKRLHKRYLDRLVLLGRYWEEHGDWKQALAVYLQMLEMDDSQELVYQRLITCYQNQGLIAEAMAVYERCREALFTHYDIPPSAETEAIYKRLR